VASLLASFIVAAG